MGVEETIEYAVCIVIIVCTYVYIVHSFARQIGERNKIFSVRINDNLITNADTFNVLCTQRLPFNR